MPSVLIKIEGLHSVRVIEIDVTDTIQVLAPTYARLTHLEPAMTQLAAAIGCKMKPGVIEATAVATPMPDTDRRISSTLIEATAVVDPLDPKNTDAPVAATKPNDATAAISPIPSSVFRGRAT